MPTPLRTLASRSLAKLRTNHEGQTLVEYVLIVGIVSVGLLVALGLLAGGLGQTYDAITGQL